jgi:hypothetical protein
MVNRCQHSRHKWRSVGLIYMSANQANPGDLIVKNELFINNGDLTLLKELLNMVLTLWDYQTMQLFFDYDHDGDLDCYLLNNSFQSVTEYDIKPGPASDYAIHLGSNKLYRNDNGHFVDVSKEAGILWKQNWLRAGCKRWRCESRWMAGYLYLKRFFRTRLSVHQQ